MTGRAILAEKAEESRHSRMSQDSNMPSSIEQIVSRALRDNLERLQRNSDELHQAVADVVAACSSAKPANALPPMLRAQTSAASLSAALEVLSRFVAVTLQPAPKLPFEADIARLMASAQASPEAAAAPVSELAPAKFSQPIAPAEVAHKSEPPVASPAVEHGHEQGSVVADTMEVETAPVAAGESEEAAGFSVDRLSPEEQELHRRANRVAKVSMQDIKMLHPEKVRLGRQHKDLCNRLRDDIEKAHREYDRRFKPIMDHPVDYFYRWMVEILAEGDAHALGDYPYATTGARH
jgi:hypothetical protein